MKLSFKNILPILLIFTLLILFAGCTTTPSPGYTPGTITGIIAAPCCSTSADPVTELSCVYPEYWYWCSGCYDCEENWNLQDGIEVVLTYGEDEIATVFTNEDGEYAFTNVPPGKNYVITAFCPDDDRPLVKDVALEVVEGETYDAKITDCVSTSLGLVVDFLVSYTELGPEDINLEPVVADKPNFWSFPRFKKLVDEVCRAEGECVNLNTDEDVQDALCEAAEEVGQIVIPDLELGCGPGPGYTPGEGEGECEKPTVEAGGPYSETVCPGANAIIDLTGSGTSTGTLSYAWDLDNDGQYDDSTAQNPQDVSFTAGAHTVTLQVTDDCGSTTDTATVTITESAARTAEAGGPYSATVCTGANALIDLTGFGIGTGTLSYAWDLDNDGQYDDSTAQNPQDVSFTAGAHTVTLQVTDDCGSTTDTATVTIDLCVNNAPTITNITDKNIAQGNTFNFTVSANDLDGDNLFYEIVSGPSTMTIDSNTGAITWVAACSDPVTSRCHIICNKEVTVKVTDDGCDGCCPLSAQDTFIIHVWDQLP